MYNYILVSTEIALNINSPSWGRNRHQVKRQLMQRVRDPILPLALGFWNRKTAEFLVPKVWSWEELINVGRKEQFYNSLITISNNLRSKVGRDNSSWQNLWGHCNLRKETPIRAINAKLGDYEIIDFIKEFFDISYASLKQNKLAEEKYLEPVYEFISLKQVPADNLIKQHC